MDILVFLQSIHILVILTNDGVKHELRYVIRFSIYCRLNLLCSRAGCVMNFIPCIQGLDMYDLYLEGVDTVSSYVTVPV